MSQIALVFSVIFVAVRPGEDSLAVLLALRKSTFVDGAVSPLLLSLAVHLSQLPLAIIEFFGGRFCVRLESSLSMRKIVQPLAHVNASIRVDSPAETRLLSGLKAASVLDILLA